MGTLEVNAMWILRYGPNISFDHSRRRYDNHAGVAPDFETPVGGTLVTMPAWSLPAQSPAQILLVLREYRAITRRLRLHSLGNIKGGEQPCKCERERKNEPQMVAQTPREIGRSSLQDETLSNS